MVEIWIPSLFSQTVHLKNFLNEYLFFSGHFPQKGEIMFKILANFQWTYS